MAGRGVGRAVFKMSSMVGGALGVAILSAFARGFTMAGAGDAILQTGLTQDSIDQAQQALVNSASYEQALASLPPDVAASVTTTVIVAFSTGLGRTMLAAAALSLVITVVVAFLWPRRATGADLPPPNPRSTS